MTTGRIERLDMFRGAAAIAVVLYHFGPYLDIPGLGLGFLAVDLFFILSGIVLAMKYTDAIEGGFGFGQFSIARLQRLYPMAFIAGAFVTVLNLAGVPSGAYVTSQDCCAWTLFLVTPAPGLGSSASAFPPDGPAWSLWAELASNVLWFATIKLGRRWMRVVGPAFFLFMIFLAWRNKSLNFGYQGGLDWRLQSVVLAMAWFSVGYAIGVSKIRIAIPSSIFLAFFLAISVAVSASGREGWRASFLIVAAGALLLASLYQAPRLGPRMSVVARYLGMASYPLYLIHAPAGRLLPGGSDLALHWIAFVGILLAVTVGVTFLNERSVRLLHQLVLKVRRANV